MYTKRRFHFTDGAGRSQTYRTFTQREAERMYVNDYYPNTHIASWNFSCSEDRSIEFHNPILSDGTVILVNFIEDPEDGEAQVMREDMAETNRTGRL